MEHFKGHTINDGIAIGQIVYFDTTTNLPTTQTKNDDIPLLLCAQELTPNQVLHISTMAFGGLVLLECAGTSHTAILTKTMGTPSIFGVPISPNWHGQMAIIDGYDGHIIISPDQETIHRYLQKKQQKEEEAKALARYIGKRTTGPNGKPVCVYANINQLTDIEKAIRADAEGVFFKTEFLFIEAESYPTEDMQFEAYMQIVGRMKEKRTVIRTMDIGADKTAPYFALDAEENPSLGHRGIRLCLDRKDMFLAQYRAILRASAYGNVGVMLPMIVSLQEVKEAKEILAEAMAQLEREGVDFNRNIPFGIMIETPAAALISHELAPLVDFFSIGTNDLTQYTLAADRQNPKVKNVYDTHHPAVLHLLRLIISNANNAGIEVGMSGEMASDTSMTKTLSNWGMDVFAVAPQKVLTIRQILSDTD